MLPVERQQGVVRGAGLVIDPVEVRPVVRSTERARPGVICAEDQAAGEPTRESGLPRIVIRGAAELVERDIAETRVGTQEIAIVSGRSQNAAVLGGVLILRRESGAGAKRRDSAAGDSAAPPD